MDSFAEILDHDNDGRLEDGVDHFSDGEYTLGDDQVHILNKFKPVNCTQLG